MPIDYFRSQLATHYQRLMRINVSIGAQDGGPRMSFKFMDSIGASIVQWEDWASSIDDVEAELRRSWSTVHRDGFGYAYSFRVHDRHRTPTTSATQP